MPTAPAPPAATPSPRTLAAIDLLRFACAAMVVAFHYGTAFACGRGEGAHRALAGIAVPHGAVAWTWFGWIGVEIFFVISGYVIFASATGATPIAFLRARALRLVPAAWLCASVTAAILLTLPFASGWVVALGWLDAIAFVPVGVQIDGSYWTLGIEIAFYLVVAIGILRNSRRSTVLAIVTIVGALSIDYWLAQAAFADVIPYPGRLRMLLLLPHGAFFALGAILRDLGARGRPTWWELGFLIALLGACGLEIAVHSAQIARDFGLDANASVPMALFAGAVVVIAGAGRLQPWCARHLSTRAAVAAGLATYPLYLIHQDAGAVVIAWLCHLGLPYAAAAPATAALALGFAVAVALRAEPWLRERLRRVTAGRVPGRDRLRTAFPPAG